MAADLLEQIRGVNPVTGASPGFVESVAEDSELAALALALRSMPVGSFQALNGDLRSVEAACRAAVALRDLFNAHGVGFKKVKPVDPEPVVNGDVTADDGRSAQPENAHRGTDDDEARSNEQEKLVNKNSASDHPVTTAKASTDAKTK